METVFNGRTLLAGIKEIGTRSLRISKHDQNQIKVLLNDLFLQIFIEVISDLEEICTILARRLTDAYLDVMNMEFLEVIIQKFKVCFLENAVSCVDHFNVEIFLGNTADFFQLSGKIPIFLRGGRRAQTQGIIDKTA